ncbi:prepilin peptidase [Candidatus Nitrospira bockiana]
MEPLVLIAGVLGLLVGSFLNVCIHRLPRRESVAWPPSRCPACRSRIGPLDNIPVISYLVLRGRCRRCSARISWRYPLVETLNGSGYAVIVWHFGLGWPAAAYAILVSALLTVTFIDLDHQIIPDRITLPGIALGLLAGATILPVGFIGALAGMLLGGGVLWALAVVSPYLFGKEGMGGGDIKLLAMIGAFLGWKPVVLTILIGAVIGAVVGISLIACKIMRRDQYLPFGPFLALGAVISLFFHQELFHWYFGLLS